MTITIQQAIDTIIASIQGAPFSDTVDTVKLGDASQPLTGIAVTFLTTSNVIKKAVQLGANLIITHEPTFYNHRDETDWLRANDIYQSKRQLIEENHLVIWRFHDTLHSLPPDSTVMGLLKELGWEANVSLDQPWLSDVQPMILGDMAEHIKEQLGLEQVRIVGDLNMECKRAALLPGFPPAEMQIGVLDDPSVDVLIAGEIHEWETSEYVRDANLLGFKKGLIVIGHAASEEPGMRYILPWLRERLPGLSIQFVPSGSPFQYV
jgi:putative NIF3 family GTP cyclohydrolase 1 type 2